MRARDKAVADLDQLLDLGGGGGVGCGAAVQSVGPDDLGATWQNCDACGEKLKMNNCTLAQ